MIKLLIKRETLWSKNYWNFKIQASLVYSTKICVYVLNNSYYIDKYFLPFQNGKSIGRGFGNSKDVSDIMTDSFRTQLVNMGTRAQACKYIVTKTTTLKLL